MAKHIQAYFMSEDQAEGARTSLLPFEMEQVEVSSLDHSIGRSHNILVPLLPLNSTTTNTGGTYGAVGIPGTVSAQGVIPVVAMGDDDSDDGRINGERVDTERDRPDFDSELDPVIDANNFSDDDFSNLKYVLTAKVKETDYDDIVHKLRSRGAFVEHLD
ncbi:hypothetical protein NYE70_10695 [Paenibacillus sp. FSL R5-0407]|uniref:hypothetical protein n=1 Tax=Paenibacillus sp. FSL R5-0407 TaxID=2975320 RepID=UPI0030F870E2